MEDPNLILTMDRIRARHVGAELIVASFFDEPTNTASYVVHDHATKRGAVIDSVLTSTQPPDADPQNPPMLLNIQHSRSEQADERSGVRYHHAPG